MNEHGLTLAIMVSLDGPRGSPGVPTLLLLRRILRRARTVGEAERMLSQARIASSNSVMLVDADGQASVAEISPTLAVFRRPRQGVLAAADSFISREHAGSGPCRRYQALLRGARALGNTMTLSNMQRLLAETALDPINLQAVVFEPTRRRAWLSLDSTPAARGPYVSVDLAALFTAHQ